MTRTTPDGFVGWTMPAPPGTLTAFEELRAYLSLPTKPAWFSRDFAEALLAEWTATEAENADLRARLGELRPAGFEYGYGPDAATVRMCGTSKAAYGCAADDGVNVYVMPRYLGPWTPAEGANSQPSSDNEPPPARTITLVDVFLRVTGLTPAEAGRLLGVSANAIAAWSRGARMNEAHRDRLDDLNSRAQLVPSKTFYGRRNAIFAARDGQPSIYDQWLAESWTPPVEPDGEAAYFEAGVHDTPGLATGGYVSNAAPALDAGCTFPMPSRAHLEASVRVLDLEEFHELAEDAIEGNLISWEAEGWHEWPLTWQERFGWMGHPRVEGTNNCATCSRYVACSLKMFANMIAVTAAKKLADRLGVGIRTEPADGSHIARVEPAREIQDGRVHLHRRTPEEARAWLAEHRAEQIARGIPAEILDHMIEDTYTPKEPTP